MNNQFRSAINMLSSLCSWSAGGAVQLRACFVRYGNDSFLGKQDTAVLFKKCGGTPGDAGGVAMRDSALGALVAAAAPEGGGYRAGGSGAVQAMSQCVGDLDAKACSDRISAATRELKVGCGYATAGAVSSLPQASLSPSSPSPTPATPPAVRRAATLWPSSGRPSRCIHVR
jgi:hypothetical protein